MPLCYASFNQVVERDSSEWRGQVQAVSEHLEKLQPGLALDEGFLIAMTCTRGKARTTWVRGERGGGGVGASRGAAAQPRPRLVARRARPGRQANMCEGEGGGKRISRTRPGPLG